MDFPVGLKCNRVTKKTCVCCCMFCSIFEPSQMFNEWVVKVMGSHYIRTVCYVVYFKGVLM